MYVSRLLCIQVNLEDTDVSVGKQYEKYSKQKLA